MNEAEYEDDFEKDLDWLISEESRGEDQGPNYEDIEAEIDRELADVEEPTPKQTKHQSRDDKILELDDDDDQEEDRWPSPMEPLELDPDRETPDKQPPSCAGPVPLPFPDSDEQTEEERRYMMEKIQQANRELQDQEAPDMTRRRRLHFKDTLVDLVVPPPSISQDKSEEQEEATNKAAVEDDSNSKSYSNVNTRGEENVDVSEVQGRLSELKLSPREDKDKKTMSGGLKMAGESVEGSPEGRDGRVLIEKDGKFDLVSLKEVESHGLLLPPILTSDGVHSSSNVPPGKKHAPTSSISSSPPRSLAKKDTNINNNNNNVSNGNRICAPKPPAQPRVRPSSASHGLRANQKSRGVKRRVQSASGMSSHSTFTLTPQQKETLLRIQEKKERLAKEAEEKKREEEEQKRQENELAFNAWLMRKREQILEGKRVQRAQEMERMHCKKDAMDAEEAFRQWLQRKHVQQQKEKQLVELKRLEDTSYLLHSREDCELAFRRWLRRKRAERQAEQQAARERSRRLVLEERQARRMKDLMCSVHETNPFRFNEQLSYRF